MSAAAPRARRWHHARQAAVCDRIELWEHGSVLRSSSHPNYWDFNLVRVEDDPPLSASELMAFADEALAGLAHRRIDFDLAAAAERVRAEFAAAGWHTARLLFMRHEAAPYPGGSPAVEVVPYAAVAELRLAWHREDFPRLDEAEYHRQARDVALRRGVRVLVARDGSGLTGFAQIEHHAGSAEIAQVYVLPQRRGCGVGTALTRAAIEAAAPARELWIAADEEGRAKELYARLGFRPAWTMMELTRLP